MMTVAIVALGGNVGDVPETFRQAMRMLALRSEVRDLRCSRLYRSVPMGTNAGETFFNAAIAFETTIDAESLLDLLQHIELSLGRVRSLHWGPRTLDLDLIAFGTEVISTPRLTVPHPHCWYRRFVLDPVCDVAAEAMHATLSLPMRVLRDRLVQRPLLVAIAGQSLNAPQLDEVKQSFSDVAVFNDAPSSTAVVMTVRFGQPERSPQPFELVCENVELGAVFLKDVLTAATDELDVVDVTLL